MLWRSLNMWGATYCQALTVFHRFTTVFTPFSDGFRPFFTVFTDFQKSMDVQPKPVVSLTVN
jgi:hypothetical protein